MCQLCGGAEPLIISSAIAAVAASPLAYRLGVKARRYAYRLRRHLGEALFIGACLTVAILSTVACVFLICLDIVSAGR